jgi:hypothetical protein
MRCVGFLIMCAALAKSTPLPLYGLADLPLNFGNLSDFHNLFVDLNNTFNQVLQTDYVDGRRFWANQSSFSFALFEANQVLFSFNNAADKSFLAPESTKSVDGTCS